MNKHEFIKQLEHYLRHLTDDDRNDAIEYYSEYINDLGLDDNADVCARIGTPREVSRQIIAQTTERRITEQTKKKTVRGSGSILWLIILGIFASPIALPIAIAAVVIIIALVITVGSVLLSFFIAGGAMVIGGIALALLSFATGSIAQVFVCIGSGLLVAGLGILILFATGKVTSLIIRGFSAIINRILSKKSSVKGELA
ncbi:MAG: DUF1700 domain-containing protein [Lachnospiraceae bacterium]|nr:DUF1700 domain-containing protein [Lachnospiraceae bacterium]